MKLSSFNTVTTFSKILAAVLFVTLPMVTLFIGMEYQKRIMMAYYKTVPSSQSVCPTSIKTANETFGRSYLHARGKYFIQYPSSWRLSDEEHEVGEPVNAISSINIKNEQSKYNTFISIKVDRGSLADYKSVFEQQGVIKESTKYVVHDAVGKQDIVNEGNFDVISYILERKGLVYDISLNVLKKDPNKNQEMATLEKIFSTFEFQDNLLDNCKQ